MTNKDKENIFQTSRYIISEPPNLAREFRCQASIIKIELETSSHNSTIVEKQSFGLLAHNNFSRHEITSRFVKWNYGRRTLVCREFASSAQNFFCPTEVSVRRSSPEFGEMTKIHGELSLGKPSCEFDFALECPSWLTRA